MDGPSDSLPAESGDSSSMGTLITTSSGKVLAASAGARSMVEVSVDGVGALGLVGLTTKGDRERVSGWLGQTDDSAPDALRFNCVGRSGGLVRCRARRTDAVGEPSVVVELAMGASAWTDVESTVGEARARVSELSAANDALAERLHMGGTDTERVAAAVESLDQLIERTEANGRYDGEPITSDVLLSLGRVSEAVEQLVASCGVGRDVLDHAESGDQETPAVGGPSTPELPGLPSSD